MLDSRNEEEEEVFEECRLACEGEDISTSTSPSGKTVSLPSVSSADRREEDEELEEQKEEEASERDDNRHETRCCSSRAVPGEPSFPYT